MAKSAEEIRADMQRILAEKAKNLPADKCPAVHGSAGASVTTPSSQLGDPLNDPENPRYGSADETRVLPPKTGGSSGGAETVQAINFERETRMQGESMRPTTKDREEPRSPVQKLSWTGDKPNRSPTGVARDIHRMPPHSVEAEQGVLGSMLCDSRTAVPIARQMIGSEQMFVPTHRTIFDALVDIFENEGAVDLITFTQYLRDVGQLDRVGGPGYVMDLFTFVPTSANITYYLEIVRDKYILREIIAASTESVRRAYEEQDEVDTLLGEHEARILAVQSFAQVGRMRLPGLSDASLYSNGNRPPLPAELVQGILHRGSKFVIGGTSKGRKTMALIDLAVSVATGTPWWGFPCERGPVCYLNFEIPEAFFWYRVELICKAKGVTLDKGMLLAWNLRGHSEGIENLTDDLMAVLRRRAFVLDIVDPIYKALGDRDENKAGDVASMLNELEKISVKTGAAVGFGAHYSKGNQALKESIDRIGGSGVFARDPDSILTMTAHKEEECFTVETTLRNHPPLDPFVVKWNWPLFSRDQQLDPTQLKQAKNVNSGQFESKYDDALIIDSLSVIHGVKPGKLLKQISELKGISRAQFYRLAKKLHDKNLIVERDGEWFRGNGREPVNT